MNAQEKCPKCSSPTHKRHCVRCERSGRRSGNVITKPAPQRHVGRNAKLTIDGVPIADKVNLSVRK